MSIFETKNDSSFPDQDFRVVLQQIDGFDNIEGYLFLAHVKEKITKEFLEGDLTLCIELDESETSRSMKIGEMNTRACECCCRALLIDLQNFGLNYDIFDHNRFVRLFVMFLFAPHLQPYSFKVNVKQLPGDYRDYGDCLFGDGLVHMADGSFRPVCELSVGDRIISFKNGEYQNAKIDAKILVKNPDTKQSYQASEIDGKHLLTSTHPIRLRGAKNWIMPRDAFPVKDIWIDVLYNFVVDTRSSIFINGIEVASVGQCCEGIDPEDGSSPFGERMVDTLKKDPCFPNVVIESSNSYFRSV